MRWEGGGEEKINSFFKLRQTQLLGEKKIKIKTQEQFSPREFWHKQNIFLVESY